jgi:hypothetical protein
LARDSANGVGAIQARFAGHAYDPHRHDEWLVGVTDRRVQDFACRGARRRSTPGRVILIEPGEAHDGRAGDAGGFAYRMLYLPRPWLRAGLGGAPGGDPASRPPCATTRRSPPPSGRPAPPCSARKKGAWRLHPVELPPFGLFALPSEELVQRPWLGQRLTHEVSPPRRAALAGRAWAIRADGVGTTAWNTTAGAPDTADIEINHGKNI